MRLQKIARESVANPSPFGVGYRTTARCGLTNYNTPAFVRRYEHLLNGCRKNTKMEEYFENFSCDWAKYYLRREAAFVAAQKANKSQTARTWNFLIVIVIQSYCSEVIHIQ